MIARFRRVYGGDSYGKPLLVFKLHRPSLNISREIEAEWVKGAPWDLAKIRIALFRSEDDHYLPLSDLGAALPFNTLNPRQSASASLVVSVIEGSGFAFFQKPDIRVSLWISRHHTKGLTCSPSRRSRGRKLARCWMRAIITLRTAFEPHIVSSRLVETPSSSWTQAMLFLANSLWVDCMGKFGGEHVPCRQVTLRICSEIWVSRVCMI